MPSGRRSKRLAACPPEGGLPAKRRVKPNSYTLAEFLKQQSLTRQDKRPKKRAPKPPEPTPPCPLKRSARGTLIKVSSSPTKPVPPSSPPVPDGTPLLVRKRAAAPRSSPFDPSHEGKLPHRVSIYITPVIDGNHKEEDVVLNNIDINDPFRASLDDLYTNIYDKYIKG